MSYSQVFGGQNIFPAQLTLLELALTADVTLVWPIEQALPDSNVFADIMAVTPDAAGRVITMPDATLAGNGQSTLMQNFGSDTFSVEDADGNTIGAVPSGEVWQFYLRTNTTTAGVWETFQFGTGVSSATAAALAGAGLKAITTTLNVKILPQDVAATPHTVLITDRAQALRWTGGVGTFNLPDPAALGADWFVWIKNAGSGTLTLTPAAGTINGATSAEIVAGGSILLVSDGTNWFTMADGSNDAGAFDYTAISVAGTGTYVLSGNELDRVAYKLTGVLTGTREIEVPATIQQYWINNATTGDFNLTVKTNAGSGIVVPQNAQLILYCDGTDVVIAQSAVKQVAGLRTIDTSETLVISDAGKILSHTVANGDVYTVPANATVAYPIGTFIDFDNRATVTLTVAAAGGVTIVGGNMLVGPSQRARLWKVGTNTWVPNLSAQPRLACYARNLAQTIANNTATDVAFDDTDLIDTGGWHDNVGTPTIFTVPAGVTSVYAQALLNWVDPTETDIFLTDAAILKNAASVNIDTEQRGMVFGDDGSGLAAWVTNLSGLILVAPGDQIKCRVTCSSTPGAGNKTLEAYFSIFAL